MKKTGAVQETPAAAQSRVHCDQRTVDEDTKKPRRGPGVLGPSSEASGERLGQPKLPLGNQPNLPEVEAIRNAAYVRM
jgi:hypothetical protein